MPSVRRAELAELPGVSLVMGAADRGGVVAKLDRLTPGQVEVAVSPIDKAQQLSRRSRH